MVPTTESFVTSACVATLNCNSLPEDKLVATTKQVVELVPCLADAAARCSSAEQFVRLPALPPLSVHQHQMKHVMPIWRIWRWWNSIKILFYPPSLSLLRRPSHSLSLQLVWNSSGKCQLCCDRAAIIADDTATREGNRKSAWRGTLGISWLHYIALELQRACSDSLEGGGQLILTWNSFETIAIKFWQITHLGFNESSSGSLRFLWFFHFSEWEVWLRSHSHRGWRNLIFVSSLSFWVGYQSANYHDYRIYLLTVRIDTSIQFLIHLTQDEGQRCRNWLFFGYSYFL